MTSSDYGKLVENSKTNFAQTVVNKSVETITQAVHQTRGRREGRSFREQVRHDLDNHEGTEKVRGIYQWVDKEYSLRVLNYGKRLMYDVVVPSLPPCWCRRSSPPSSRRRSSWSSRSTPSRRPTGSTPPTTGGTPASTASPGRCRPPPAVYDQRTVSSAQPVVGSEAVKAYGIDVTPAKTGAMKIQIPEGYQALSGYVQMTNAELPRRATRSACSRSSSASPTTTGC